jgi:hypothetical protein
MFRLTTHEVTDLESQISASSKTPNRSQFVTGSEKHRNPRFPPFALTEHGALMAANVLRSPRTVEMSLFAVRAFLRLRRSLAGHAEFARRLDEMKVGAFAGERDGRRQRKEENRSPDQAPGPDVVRSVWTRI